MTKSPSNSRNSSDQRTLRWVRIALIAIFGGGTAFMAVVAFYSLIPQVFYADAPDTPYSPCETPDDPSCANLPCDARLSALLGDLLDRLADQSANPRPEDQDSFFQLWDANYRSLAQLCEEQSPTSYEALAHLRYRVETDLVQLNERYLPILEQLPPRRGPGATEAPQN